MKQRIAWFTPDFENLASANYPLSKYFTDLLVPILSADFEIEVFINSFNFKNFKHLDSATHHYLRALEIHEQRPFDLFFYQLENNKHTDFARVHSVLQPGVIFFHDFIFSSFGPEPILNSPWHNITELFNERCSSWPVSGEKNFSQGPLAFRESAFALAAIFSNPNYIGDFKQQIKAQICNTELHFLSPPVSPFSLSEEREAGTLIFCGTPGVEYRAHSLLAALQSSSNWKLKWLVDSHEQEQALKLLAEFQNVDCELVIGRTPERWQSLQGKASLAVHTLFSFYCNLSPYFEISAAAGTPLVLSDFGFADSLPSNLFYKVSVGSQEIPELQKLLQAFQTSTQQQLNKKLSEEICAYAREEYSLPKVAAELKKIMTQAISNKQEVLKKWSRFELQARQELYRAVRSSLLVNDAILQEFDEYLCGNLGSLNSFSEFKEISQ